MTVSSGANDPRGSLLAVLRPFTGQTVRQHLLVAAVSLAVWTGAFLAVLSVLGGESIATADTTAAVQARQTAGVLAGLGCGAYLGVAFARERGGPVTNLLFAPLSAAVGATGAPIAAVYGTAPTSVFSTATSTLAVGGGVGTTVVLASATVVTGTVVAVHLAVLAAPAQRRRVIARFAELPGVHPGPRPLEDWRHGDGGGEGDPDELRVDGGDPDGDTDR